MKQTVTETDFVQAFADCNRSEDFSIEGRIALYEFITQLDDECGTETELDVIALCCDFDEWESLEEFQQNYGEEYDSFETINDHTLLIDIDGERFITHAF